MKYGKLIGIVGYQSAGKTTLTRPMQAEGFVCVGFSDPLYSMVTAMGVPSEIVNEKARWDEPLAILSGKTVRHAVRTLGTEWGRDYIGEQVWTGIALARAHHFRKNGISVIIDNVRFPSEFDDMRGEDAEMIALHNRRVTMDPSHESEMYVHELQRRCERQVYNDGDQTAGIAAMRRTILELFE